MTPRPPARTDSVLLLEVALVLLLLGLFIALYLVPAGDGSLQNERQWWVAPLLAALFFGVLYLETWRRKRRARTGLSNALSDTDPLDSDTLR